MKLRVPNVGLKAVALALALLTWFALRSKIIEQSEYLECPVTVTVPDTVVVQNADSLSVGIKVQGPVEAVADFEPDEQTLRLDARAEVRQALAGGVASATIRLPITSSDFRLPRRLGLVKVRPEYIQLRVERLKRTVLPVDVATLGEPADGYRIVEEATRAMPSTVALDLGAEEAAEIGAVKTTPVNVAGCTGTVRDKAYLIDPRSTSGKRLGPSVDVIVTIAPDLRDKELAPVPIMLLKRPNDRSRVEVDPGTIAITVRGRADLLASLGPEAATAHVAIGEEMTPDFTYTLLPVVTIKVQGIEVVGVPEVKVTISSGSD
jgi:hypothetical protein